jgi:hypothetical protein
MKAFWNIENIDVILQCRFFIYLSWIMTRELAVNRFHSKSIYVLRDKIIYHLTFLWFLFNVVVLTTIFPSQLDLLILQTSLLSHWSFPPILDMISTNK